MKPTAIILHRISMGAMVSLLLFVTVILLSYKNPSANTREQHLTATDTKPVAVLELFTSQGCSSCPPADALLAEYAKAHNEQIIPLSFHVDYWNRLGWTDPFSNRSYSERQQWYSQHLPHGSVYTPQLVVNGKAEAVGNNRTAVHKLVQNALVGRTLQTVSVQEITKSKNVLHFRYAIDGDAANLVLQVALVEKKVTTHIQAGENEGVTLTNHNIVRGFRSVQALKGGEETIGLPSSFKAGEYALVIYLQNKNDQQITTGIMKEIE